MQLWRECRHQNVKASKMFKYYRFPVFLIGTKESFAIFTHLQVELQWKRIHAGFEMNFFSFPLIEAKKNVT